VPSASLSPVTGTGAAVTFFRGLDLFVVVVVEAAIALAVGAAESISVLISVDALRFVPPV
jgi:hypothetical protein